MFRNNQSGSIATIFAIALPVLLTAVSGAIEMTRATAYKQRLASATELACNQAAVYVRTQRKTDLTKDYTGDVARVIAANLREKGITNATSQPPTLSLTNVRVENSGTFNSILSTFLPRSTISFNVVQDCSLIPIANGTGTEESKLLFSESFEVNHSVQPNSWDVLKNWNGWTTTNAGVEINGQRALAGNTMKNGDFFAELDSDCGTWVNSGVRNCQSNSAMTRTVDLNAGVNEIRYWYVARQGYINVQGYGTQPICSDLTKAKGSARDDFADRATRESTVRQAVADGQTFRIEVYVDGASDTLFTSSNLVDACIWANPWIERKISFTVLRKGSYRISWRAGGRQDTYGGLIDYLRICEGTCP
ncbi:pilus assembly protein [Methylobacterium sp. J-078]|uniref:TadE/TadG family type IV pilus assembly protein n=1 Tax=Methylobacterium sp. J-078 TaxID=2836657 RepID=UPI001FBB3F12|nr:TadE/TadG family type IV pilus assembly protein [Methylobacterium sp. J-078]MCJ2044488.1 pilus assembly protein [Methylobacterium sp. J-078]